MSDYTTLFSSVLLSTVWQEDTRTRIVWITLMAISNKRGEVMASVPGLASVAKVPIDAVEAALEKFLAPDLHSRTKEYEGRRIATIDGGWVLLNYPKYRDIARRAERKSSNAERQRRFRERKRSAPSEPGHLTAIHSVHGKA